MRLGELKEKGFICKLYLSVASNDLGVSCLW